jgi:hypothetical protein
MTPVAAVFRMAPPPATYLLWLLAIATGYALAAQLVKRKRLRRTQSWL